MTRKTTKAAEPVTKKSKQLNLGKKTLKDLAAHGKGPRGGKGRLTTAWPITAGCCP